MNSAYAYISAEKNSYKTTRVPLTSSKDWNMSEHIERCFNVANGWFHNGKNDGLRPYNDIVTPIIDVAFRSEGFDVKDIVPYVDDIKESYKSFLVKKMHPEWAKKNQLDTFIDEVVESSIIYDLVLVEDVNSVRPEVVALQDIAFCDQTDILSGPICIRHQFSVSEILEYKDKWNPSKIDEAIVMAKASKEVSIANNQEVKTPGKYIEVYRLIGSLPESWLREDGDPDKYVDQMHVVTYYTSSDGVENGITLYKGKSRKVTERFKALKIDTVRSKGRACGKSIVERLFEPQVWNNYGGIKLKKMLDSAVNLITTDSDEWGNKKIGDLKENTVIKLEPGRKFERVDMQLQNVTTVQNYQVQNENQARVLGSASEAKLGVNPSSGTPFALQELVVNENDGIHKYRQGKIATFFSDVLYPELILGYLVKDLNNGTKFSEELSLTEMNEIAEIISTNKANEEVIDAILDGGEVSPEEQTALIEFYKEGFKKDGNRKFFEILKSEFADTPIKVHMNIAGKQKYLAQQADKLSKLISNILANAQGIATIPGIGNSYNQLLEASGLSPIDFSTLVNSAQSGTGVPTEKIVSPISKEELSKETTLTQ